MNEHKKTLLTIYIAVILAIGFRIGRPVLLLIIGAIPVLLFIIFINDKNIKAVSTNTDAKINTTHKNTKQIDKTHICFKFSQNFHEHNQRMKQQEHKYPLVAGAELLFEKGFVFCRAVAGGGINEIGHTGDMAYDAEYTDFIDFRDNFEKDMDQAEQHEVETSGGWVSSLNYGYINIYLKNDKMRVSITVDCSTVTVNWYDVTNKNAPIFDELNKKILEVLGNGVKFNKETCYKSNPEIEKKHLSHWEINNKTT